MVRFLRPLLNLKLFFGGFLLMSYLQIKLALFSSGRFLKKTNESTFLKGILSSNNNFYIHTEQKALIFDQNS